MTENGIGKIVVDAAIAVHRALGPGLLESVYEADGLTAGREPIHRVVYNGELGVLGETRFSARLSARPTA